MIVTMVAMPKMQPALENVVHMVARNERVTAFVVFASSAMSAVGTLPSFNLTTDVTRNGKLFGRDATHHAGVFFNYENLTNFSYNVAPGGNGILGALTSQTWGHHWNGGARGREEVRLDEHWTAEFGIGIERTHLRANTTNYAYPVAATATLTVIPALRTFVSAAPEAALFYRVNRMWKAHGRFGTGYGTPQASNLFVTPEGISGNNTKLKSQSNYGFDRLGDRQSPQRERHRLLRILQK